MGATYLLDRTVVDGVDVALLGEQYTGALVVQVNGRQLALPRDYAGQLRDRLTAHLAATEDCPRCGHSRLDHFTLWTHGGKLYGCSNGTGERWALAEGLPCDCPGIPPEAAS